LNKRKIEGFAPFPLEIYENLLNLISKDRKINCGQFPSSSYHPQGDKINIFIRHDIDNKQCILNLPSILEIERSQKKFSGIYLRVDDAEYCVAEYKHEINSLINEGFEVGLHTVCYLKEDYLAEFRRETEKLSDELGFRPRSFTVHGMGGIRLTERLQFCEEIVSKIGEFGYQFTDCHEKVLSYDYVIEDCHWDEVKKARYIYDDFVRLPSFFKRGRNYLILTHPCYWV
jgi:hypothetical protein